MAQVKLSIMPTELGDTYSIEWRGRPKQMLSQDVPVWHAFLDQYGTKFQHFYYNVCVGGANWRESKEDPVHALMWYHMTCKRIDALGVKPEEIWIIEVATVPGLRAVGQLMTYFHLWNLEPLIDLPIKNVLVCERLDDDLTYVLQKYGISIIKV